MEHTQIASDIDAEDKLRALDEILHSETFARSARLRSLLRFICEAEIQGRAADLNEYAIGIAALGRPADFSPLEDSSVRSRAHELRQRLEKYYTSEAPHALIRVELRRGTYVPRFYASRTEEAGQPATAPTASEPTEIAPAPAEQPAAPRRGLWTWAVSFAAGAVAAFLGIAVWSTMASPGTRIAVTHLETAAGKAWTPELEAVWHPFFGRGEPLLIVYETRLFIRIGPLMVRDWHINTPEQVGESDDLRKVQQLFEKGRIGNREYADGGTPQAIFSLTRLLSTRVPVVALKNALDLTAADLRDNNVIVLGKPGMDPEIERLLARTEIIDTGTGIRIAHPAPGEPPEYHDQSDPADPDRWGQKYSTITMMPGAFPGRRILSLTASGSEQPASLAFFMTNADTVRELVRAMGGRSAMPEYFQVLVRADYKNKAVVKVVYITHRVLRPDVFSGR